MEQVIALEDKTDRYEDALNTYLVKLSGMNLSVQDNRILNTLLYSISDIERMADHAMAVAKAALEMEAHEYLNALKAGELQESATFSERFAQYKTRYTFPEER